MRLELIEKDQERSRMTIAAIPPRAPGRKRSSRRIVVLIPTYSRRPKPRKPPPDPRVHGMRTDPVYDYYVFTDLWTLGPNQKRQPRLQRLPQGHKLQDRPL